MRQPESHGWRYEFRIFGPSLEAAAAALRGTLKPDRRDSEKNIYLLGFTATSLNLKVRDGRLETKRLVDVTADGLEQWRPEEAVDFPLPPDLYRDVFGLTVDEPLSLASLHRLACHPVGRGTCMHVLKDREKFRRDGMLGEICALIVNGARVDSLAIESTDVRELAETRSKLGLGDAENTGYALGLARIAGIEPLPDDSAWRAIGAFTES